MPTLNKTKLLASIIVYKDGSVRYVIQSAKGEILTGGGTRVKSPPKDPIKTACQMVERALRGLAQKR
jgi:hypothetical protein